MPHPLPRRPAFAALRQRILALSQPRARESLPVHIGHRRIYVLPTGFGLFFAALLVAMGVGALNYNNNPALLLALLLAGTALSSLLAAHGELARLDVTAIDATPVPAGQPLQLRVHLHDRRGQARRGLQLRYGEDTSAFSLDQGLGEARLPVATRRRGWLALERLQVSTVRPLGLARAWTNLWPDQPLLVYPAPETHGPPLPQGSGEQDQPRLHPAGDDLHHLRPYQRGDARRAIAWKPSARRDTLLVRAYEQPRHADVRLDWQALRALPVEARIARLAHWVDLAELKQRRYALQLPGYPLLGPDRGPAHRHACLRALALIPHAAP